MSDAVGDIEVAPRERAGGKRAAASKAKFKFVREHIFINIIVIINFQEDSGDSDEESGSDDELHDNEGIKEAKNTKNTSVFQSESEDDAPHANGNGHAMNGDDSGSDFDDPKPKKSPAKKPAKKLNTSDDLFDDMMGSKAEKPAPKKKAPKKKKAGSDDDSDDDEPKPKKAAPKKPAAAKKPAAKKPPAKKAKWDSDNSDNSDFDMDDVPVRAKTGGKKNAF